MRVYIIVILALLGFLSLSAFTPQEKAKKKQKLETFFACKQSGNIMLTAEQFLKYMEQPFCAKDSLDSLYEIVRFDMIYAETGLYQDSAGLPIVHTDYSYGTFKSNTINFNWKKLFKAQAHRGDTIRFSNILARGNDSLTYQCSDIELVLR